MMSARRSGAARGYNGREVLLAGAEAFGERAQAMPVFSSSGRSASASSLSSGRSADDVFLDAAVAHRNSSGPSAFIYGSLQPSDACPLVVGESAEAQAAVAEGLQKVKRCFVSAAVADMNAVCVERSAERLLEQRAVRSRLRSTPSATIVRRARKSRVGSATRAIFVPSRAPILPSLSRYQNARLRGCEHEGAVRGREDLRLPALNFASQRPLPVRLEAALDLVDERDGRVPCFCSAMSSAASRRVPAPQLASGS